MHYDSNLSVPFQKDLHVLHAPWYDQTLNIQERGNLQLNGYSQTCWTMKRDCRQTFIAVVGWIKQLVANQIKAPHYTTAFDLANLF